MPKTEVRQRNASDVRSSLHQLFGSASPEYIDGASSSEDVHGFLDLGFENKLHEFHDDEKGVKGYVYDLDNQVYPYGKLFWVDSSNPENFIITTTPYAHESVASKGTFGTNFNRQELNEIVEHYQSKFPEKITHLIAPRVESSFNEDHIVIEYQKNEEGQSSSCIIDSKGKPSGMVHNSIPRINLGLQPLTNSTDCGFYVSETIPVLIDLIKKDNPITLQAIGAGLDRAKIDLLKLVDLKEGYKARVEAGESRHKTFGLFEFGDRAEDKLGAVEKILDNIVANKENILDGLEPKEQTAAKNGELGNLCEAFVRHRSDTATYAIPEAGSSSAASSSSVATSSDFDSDFDSDSEDDNSSKPSFR